MINMIASILRNGIMGMSVLQNGIMGTCMSVLLYGYIYALKLHLQMPQCLRNVMFGSTNLSSQGGGVASNV